MIKAMITCGTGTRLDWYKWEWLPALCPSPTVVKPRGNKKHNGTGANGAGTQ